MIYIAHRGLFNGPSKELENHPEQVLYACSSGFHCEVDLWVIGNEYFLGHDCPDYKIKPGFLFSYPLWIHAKNIDALYALRGSELNYFWHENDAHTLTSLGFIWTNPGKELTNNSIMVMPEHTDPTLENSALADCFGICSDYVQQIKDVRSKQ